MRNKLIALSMVKNGKWREIYKFLERDRQLTSIDEAHARKLVEKLDCDTITIVDDDYPDAWREMSKPPFVVYVHGNKALLQKKLVAVVGGKRPSAYTKQALDRLFSQLPADVHVASGLEIGVESYAMSVADKRLTVLGSGVNKTDFYQNNSTCLTFGHEDLVISELPPEEDFNIATYYRSYHLICELSSVICIFELPTSDIRLKYLRHLLEIGKSIFVLPDQNKVSSQGGLRLINTGAKCLMSKSDLLNEFLI